MRRSSSNTQRLTEIIVFNFPLGLITYFWIWTFCCRETTERLQQSGILFREDLCWTTRMLIRRNIRCDGSVKWVKGEEESLLVFASFLLWDRHAAEFGVSLSSGSESSPKPAGCCAAGTPYWFYSGFTGKVPVTLRFSRAELTQERFWL